MNDAVAATLSDWPPDWHYPSFQCDVLKSRSSRYALVIPVLNEGERIRAQLARIAALHMPIDTLIADGGSTDGSLPLDFLESVDVRALLTKTGPGRLSAQLRMAYAWCLMEGYEGIVTIDGNGKDGVEAITSFIGKLDEGYDYVQGSRYRRGGQAINTPFDREIGNRYVQAPILSLFGRRWLTDTTNGFRGYSARYLLDPKVAPFRDVFVNYELLPYLTVRAGQLGYRVCEVPVTRRYPHNAPAPTKISGWKGRLAILEETLRAAIGRLNP